LLFVFLFLSKVLRNRNTLMIFKLGRFVALQIMRGTIELLVLKTKDSGRCFISFVLTNKAKRCALACSVLGMWVRIVLLMWLLVLSPIWGNRLVVSGDSEGTAH